MRDEDLMARSRRLSQAIEPTNELWTGIEQTISPRSRVYRFRVAIAATLVLGVSALVWQLTSVDPVEAPVVASTFASSEYGLLKTELMVGYEAELERASPETRQIVERNMATIAAAIVEINSALEKDPNNYLLQRMLATTYTNELKLMNETQQLSRSVRQRTQI